MKKYALTSILLSLIISLLPLHAQNNKDQANDFNTPLHLMEPDYNTPYGVPKTETIKQDLDRILAYLQEVTPAVLVNNQTGKVIKKTDQIDQHSGLKKGDFRLSSYEWGVTYAAMLTAAEVTGDERYKTYATDRFRFISEIRPAFEKVLGDYGSSDPQMRQILRPAALDDAGAMCAAMIKASRMEPGLELEPVIANYMNYIMHYEYRLHDGTFARKRPQMNTVWLDDMFMSIPAIVQMGALTGESRYFDEAVRQISLFREKMYVKEKGLFRHGWVEAADRQPAFFWEELTAGRCSRWWRRWTYCQ